MSFVPRTRHKSGSNYGGAPSELPSVHLPSNGEVATFFYLLSSKLVKNNYIIYKLVTDLGEKSGKVNLDLPL